MFFLGIEMTPMPIFEKTLLSTAMLNLIQSFFSQGEADIGVVLADKITDDCP